MARVVRLSRFMQFSNFLQNSGKLVVQHGKFRRKFPQLQASVNEIKYFRSFSTANQAVEEPPTGEKHEFQAETRMLLDIVARSLYSDKEVFIRELISNASDALEKFRYKSLVSGSEDAGRQLEIHLETDKTNRTLTIRDNGIGMNKADLKSNLGTIARSGSKAFLEEIKSKAENSESTSNIIGQFGVGFYSAFMVANKVEVFTKATGDTQGYKWTSDGSGMYEIQEADNVDYGTKIILHLKPECREFSDEDVVQNVIKKYSNFVGSPVILNGKRANTVEPLWIKNPKEVTESQHKEFYRFVSNTIGNPLFTLHYTTDAPLSIKALIYIPETAGLFDLSRDADIGVSLYTKKVLILNKADDIFPKYLRFLKGVVDCEDIPLNLSRELLQNSRLIGNLRRALTSRVLKFLQDQMRKNITEYNRFYENFSGFLREGVAMTFEQTEKEDIAKLLRYESAHTPAGTTISLLDYCKNMKDGQTEIYYLACPSRALAESSPYYESLKSRNIDVLFCYDQYDELVLMQLRTFNNRYLMSAESEVRKDKSGENIADLGENSLRRTQIDELSTWLKKTLGDRIHSVRAVSNLESHPCSITVEEMGAVRHFLKSKNLNTPRVEEYAMLKPQLDINPKSLIIQKMHKLINSDPKLAEMLANQLFLNAMVGAGLVQNAQTVVQSMNELLSKALEKY